MRATLTGATGFIGQNLTRYLEAKGWSLQTIPRGTSQMVKLLTAHRPDVVIHLASRFIAEHEPRDVGPLISSNIIFGTKLLEAMRLAGITRLVNAGTSWQNPEPVCLYAATKSAFEEILRYYVSAEDFRAVTLEIFDTYGPGDKRPKLIPKLLDAMVTRTPLDMSPGGQQLDLVHIDDIVSAFEIAAERLMEGKGCAMESFALSSGQTYSLKEIVNLLGPIDVRWGARPYRRREVMAPWSNGVPLPGWRAKISLAEGLHELVNGH